MLGYSISLGIDKQGGAKAGQEICCNPVKESINSGERNYRRLLDVDALGNTPLDGAKPFESPPSRFNHASNGESVHCAKAVAKGDYEWDIDGMSWLVNVLHQNECPALESRAFIVGGEEVTLQRCW